MKIIHDGPPRTRRDLIWDVVIFGLLSAWGVWVLYGGLRAGVFYLRVSTVEAGSFFFLVIAVILALLILVPGGLCVHAAVALSKGNWKTAPGRDTEGS